MMRLAMSPAAAALLRAMIVRAGVDRDRILLTDVRSTDWQSLTFTGERHQLNLRITGADSMAVAKRLGFDLEDAEFDISGAIVADIVLVGMPKPGPNGATDVTIEALTVVSD